MIYIMLVLFISGIKLLVYCPLLFSIPLALPLACPLAAPLGCLACR